MKTMDKTTEMEATQASTSAVVKNKEDSYMKAVVNHVYGSPDVLKLEEVAKPSPKDDEVLVEVHASSVLSLLKSCHTESH